MTACLGSLRVVLDWGSILQRWKNWIWAKYLVLIGRKKFESSICHAKCWWKLVVIITISDRSFLEKINAKSLFSILVIVTWCGSMRKKRWKNHPLLPSLVLKITYLHRSRKNRKTKNMTPFLSHSRSGPCSWQAFAIQPLIARFDSRFDCA